MPAANAHRLGGAIGAIVAVQDTAGQVLLVWQTSGPFAGHWLLPGGAVERDEGIVGAAARELHEETGLVLVGARLVAQYQVRSRPPGAYDIGVFVYTGTATGRLIAEPGSEARWFDPRALRDPHPALRRELLDAGIRADDAGAIEAALAAAGIAMERLG